MKAFVERIRKAYFAMIEKQGFPIVVTVCIGVITATAIWTKPLSTPTAMPSPSAMLDVSAAQLQQQSLREASTPTPLPAEAPNSFTPPLAAYSVLTPFSSSEIRYSSVTGIWAVHDAADLQAASGSAVFAIADGTVIACGMDKLLGSWIRIDHSEGIEALYAGMEEFGSLLAGNSVRAGEEVGFVGNGPLAESALPPHLHLRVTEDGIAVDPLALWE